MLNLNKKYCITTDQYNYILNERNIVKDENSKNYGNEVLKPIAYCGNLEQLRSFLFEREIKVNIQILKNIEKCIELKNEIKEFK